MAGAADQALGVEGTVAERGLGFRRSALEGIGDLALLPDQAHAAPAAAGNGLDHDRAMRAEEGADLLQRGRAFRTVDNRHAAALGERLGLRLVAEQLQR